MIQNSKKHLQKPERNKVGKQKELIGSKPRQPNMHEGLNTHRMEITGHSRAGQTTTHR